MSLVHDALERAREEAARREAAARGEAPLRPLPPSYRFGPNRTLLVVLVTAVLGLAGFGLWTLVRQIPRGGERPDPVAPIAPAIAPRPSVAPPAAGPPLAPPQASAPPEAANGLSARRAPPAAAPPPRAAPRPAPPAALASDGTPLELEGIVWGEWPTAVINGAVLAPGEAVGGWTLLRVEPRAVVLGDGEQEIELHLASAPELPAPATR